MIDRLKSFLDFTEGGAWSFLVRGVIRLVNSVNERDLNLLIKVQGLLRDVRRFVERVYSLLRKPVLSLVSVMLLRGTALASG